MQWHHVPSDITMVVLALIKILVMVVLAGRDAINGSTGININISTSSNTNTSTLLYIHFVRAFHNCQDFTYIFRFGASLNKSPLHKCNAV